MDVTDILEPLNDEQREASPHQPDTCSARRRGQRKDARAGAPHRVAARDPRCDVVRHSRGDVHQQGRFADAHADRIVARSAAGRHVGGYVSRPRASFAARPLAGCRAGRRLPDPRQRRPASVHPSGCCAISISTSSAGRCGRCRGSSTRARTRDSVPSISSTPVTRGWRACIVSTPRIRRPANAPASSISRSCCSGATSCFETATTCSRIIASGSAISWSTSSGHQYHPVRMVAVGCRQHGPPLLRR